MRTAPIRDAFAAAVMTIGLAAGCGVASSPTPATSLTPPASSTPTASTSRPPSSLAPTAQPTATREATATATPASTAVAGPNFVEIEPAAIIDIADAAGLIPVVTDGTTVWAAGQDALWKIDPQTNNVERLDAPARSGNTTLALADDGLWATRWEEGRLYRLNPQTGQTLLDVEMPTAVGIAFIGNDMWVGDEGRHSMFKVDRATGAADSASQLEIGAYGAAGMGDLWFIGGTPLEITRVDPATKSVKATIDFPGESNCSFYGKFPDDVWTSCFERTVRERSVAHIDPATNTVATVAKIPPSHGGGVITIGDYAWFIGTFEGPDHKPFAGLIRIDPKTGATDRFFSLAGVDPDPSVVAGDALWIPDEAGHRLLKINLADLES